MLARLNNLAIGLNRVRAGAGGWTIPLPPPEKIRFGLRYIHIYVIFYGKKKQNNLSAPQFFLFYSFFIIFYHCEQKKTKKTLGT
jgi:hypothetical protein